MAKDNKPVIASATNSRTFTYTKGQVSLNFTLSMDGTKQIADFKECLEAATGELTIILNERK